MQQLRISTLIAFLLSAQAGYGTSQETPKTSIVEPGLPLWRLLPKISANAVASDALRDVVVCVYLPSTTMDDAMHSIAKLLCARWIRTNGKDVLTPAPLLQSQTSAIEASEDEILLHDDLNAAIRQTANTEWATGTQTLARYANLPDISKRIANQIPGTEDEISVDSDQQSTEKMILKSDRHLDGHTYLTLVQRVTAMDTEIGSASVMRRPPTSYFANGMAQLSLDSKVRVAVAQMRKRRGLTEESKQLFLEPLSRDPLAIIDGAALIAAAKATAQPFIGILPDNLWSMTQLTLGDLLTAKGVERTLCNFGRFEQEQKGGVVFFRPRGPISSWKWIPREQLGTSLGEARQRLDLLPIARMVQSSPPSSFNLINRLYEAMFDCSPLGLCRDNVHLLRFFGSLSDEQLDKAFQNGIETADLSTEARSELRFATPPKISWRLGEETRLQLEIRSFDVVQSATDLPSNAGMGSQAFAALLAELRHPEIVNSGPSCDLKRLRIGNQSVISIRVQCTYGVKMESLLAPIRWDGSWIAWPDIKQSFREAVEKEMPMVIDSLKAAARLRKMGKG